ncbi:MAG: hypothetical protein ACXABY_24515 [Candidatus Thorarchaeota archaeon]
MADFDFAETVETMDTVPEKYHGLYSEGDEGKFVLSDAAKGLVGDYLGVSKSLTSSRADKKKASDEAAQRRVAVKAFEELAESLGLEPGDDGYAPALKNYLDEMNSKVKGGEAMKVNLDKVKADYEKRLNESLSAKDNEISARDKALHKHLVRNTALASLAKHKGSTELLLPHVEAMCSVMPDDNGDYATRVKDEDGDIRMNSSGGYFTVDDLVEEMKTKAAFKPAFESETPSGMTIKPGAMKRSISSDSGRELSAAEKISIGIAKGQHTIGVGRGKVA